MTKDNTRPVRVLHIASGDSWAGAEVQLFTLAKALKNYTNTAVDIILLNHGVLEEKLLSKGINVIILDESKLSSLAILWKLIRIIHEIKPSVIHTHRIKENILGSVAARLNGNIPSLRTAHGAQESTLSWQQLPKRIVRWLDLFSGRYLQQMIISVSEDLAEKLRKDFPPKIIHVIENGIDIKELQNHAIDKSENTRTEAFKVGFAGRLVPVKRIDIIIKTARHILDNYPKLDIEFYIYGDGPQREELEHLNRTLKTDGIVFFEGHRDDIFEKIQEIDALILTSDHEGLPMILLESMALGTPIISHAIGGIPNLLNQGECGILIPENKARSYAVAINQLANCSRKILEITQLAKQHVNENYSADANAQTHYLQYKSLTR